MARRLNKKVALIGSAVFMIFVVAVVLVVLHLSRDPEKFIADGDEAYEVGNYEQAAQNYQRAKSRAKDDQLRISLLYKLIDTYLLTEQWPQTRGCWQEVVKIDPENLPIRYIQLKYYYTIADNGGMRLFSDIETQATDLLEIVENKNLLEEPTSQWESAVYKKAGIEHQSLTGKGETQRIGPYLYIVRGRARYEQARMGGVTDPEKLLEKAIDDLQKGRELDPTSIVASWYDAQAIIVRGQILVSKGMVAEREKALQQAIEILSEAVTTFPDDPQGHIYLLLLKQQAEAAKVTDHLSEDWLERLEPSYLELAEKFPHEPRIYAILANLYRSMGPKYLDKSIASIEKAKELDPNNIGYVFSSADLRYLNFSITGDYSELEAAIEMLKSSIDSPSVKETAGPKQMRNLNNRANLYFLLATIYTEQLIFTDEARLEPYKQQWMVGAEEAVRQIEQILQSGEDPMVIKWQGMLELAKKNRGAGIRKLYAAYQQLNAANRIDTQLSYVLAKTFENSTELGAANEFWTAALRFRLEDRGKRDDSIDKKKPEALLDCAQLWLKFRTPSFATNLIRFYETFYGSNERSKTLGIQTLIESDELDKAAEAIEQANLDEPNDIVLRIALLQRKIRNATVSLGREKLETQTDDILEPAKPAKEQISSDKLQAEMDNSYDQMYELIRKLLNIDPNQVSDSTVVLVCNHYRKNNRPDNVKVLSNEFLKHFPDNINIKLLLKLSDAGQEPSEQVVTQMRKEILEEIPDLELRASGLGVLYSGNNQPEEAIAELNKVLEPYFKNITAKDQKLSSYAIASAARLLDESIKTQQYQLAEKVAELARVYDIDDCQGNYFKARIAVAREDYDKAMEYIDRALELRPVFSEGYAMKARIYASQDKKEQSIQNLKTALSLNPLDGNISRALAFSLYERNEKLGSNATSDQKIELMQALQRAMALNPNDLMLLGFYADYLGATEPQQALSIRQKVYIAQPSVVNAIKLGNLASKIAKAELDEKRKNTFFDIAENAFKEALRLEPDNTAAAYSYTEYQRDRGLIKEAEMFLSDMQDKRLLGQHYYGTGQYDKAQEIFEELLKDEPENVIFLRALLAISQRTQNQDGVKTYSEKLVASENSIDHNLMQIQSYLMVGLTQDSELKLQSFREKYPQEPRALLLEAWTFLNKGQLKKALEMVNKSIETDEGNSVAWQLRGQINRLLSDYTQAMIDLNKSKSLNDIPETRMELARTYMSLQRHQDAVMELAAIMDKPETPLKARSLLEQIYYSTGNVNALRQFYVKMMEMFPDNITWLNNAALFAKELKDYETSEKLYKQALDISIKAGTINPAALEGYLNSFLMQAKYDKVLSEGSKYVDSELSPLVFMQMSQAKLSTKEHQAALDYAIKAVDAADNDQALASMALKIMYDLFGPDEVKKYCQKKLEQKPNNLAPNYALYQLSRVEQDYNKAASYLDKMIEISGPQTDKGRQYRADKAQLLFTAYNVYSDNSYLNRAVDIWQDLLKELPDNTLVLNNYAYTLAYADKDVKKALEYAERAVAQSPDNPGLIDTYAYVLYKNGRFNEAEEQAQAALQQFELKEAFAPAEVYEHLAKIKEKLGATDEAVVFYTKALDVGKKTYSKEQVNAIQKAIERLSQ